MVRIALPFIASIVVLSVLACSKRDAPPAPAAAPSALTRSIKQPIERAQDVDRQQAQSADEARRKIDEATQ